MKGIYGFFLAVWLSLVSCVDYTPKPRGYFRIEPPQATYLKLPVSDLPYSFSVSDKVVIELPEEEHEGWINLNYMDYGVTLYCSYMKIQKGNLTELTDETLKLVARTGQEAKATAYENPEANVYGMFFDLQGKTASPIQFYLTDSLSHFFRGALYYHAVPNVDSIAPMTNYLRKDLIELVESFTWNN